MRWVLMLLTHVESTSSELWGVDSLLPTPRFGSHMRSIHKLLPHHVLIDTCFQFTAPSPAKVASHTFSSCEPPIPAQDSPTLSLSSLPEVAMSLSLESFGECCSVMPGDSLIDAVSYLQLMCWHCGINVNLYNVSCTNSTAFLFLFMILAHLSHWRWCVRGRGCC
jgi:hypothetical protein